MKATRAVGRQAVARGAVFGSQGTVTPCESATDGTNCSFV
jgi:hypothetical protein